LLEVNTKIYLPRFEGRWHRSHGLMGGLSRSHCRKNMWGEIEAILDTQCATLLFSFPVLWCKIICPFRGFVPRIHILISTIHIPH
jgi:hypothetical protein